MAAGLMLGTAASLVAQTSSADGSGFVYVNTQRLLESAPGAVDAQETWNRELVQMQEEVRLMRVELDSLLADYRRQETMLSETARQTRQQEMAEKNQTLQQRTLELEDQANQRRQQLLQPILERVQAEIENFRAERGFTMVFDASAAGLIALIRSSPACRHRARRAARSRSAGRRIHGAAGRPTAALERSFPNRGRALFLIGLRITRSLRFFIPTVHLDPNRQMQGRG
jgi:outer membrane protein